MTRTADVARPHRGRWFEELEPGVVVQHAVRRTLTESDNVMFTSMTMNPAWLHLDFDYAANETEFGQPLDVQLPEKVSDAKSDTRLFEPERRRKAGLVVADPGHGVQQVQCTQKGGLPGGLRRPGGVRKGDALDEFGPGVEAITEMRNAGRRIIRTACERECFRRPGIGPRPPSPV